MRYVPVMLGKIAIVLLAIACVNFVLIRLAPGDPATVLAGESGAGDQKYVEQLRHEFNLDRPYMVQMGTYLLKLAQLDLGYSHRQQRPVLDLILERLPSTLLLTVSAYVLALIVGVGLGMLAARNEGRAIAKSINVASLLLYASPSFWTGLVLILIFSVWLGWLPAFGDRSIGSGNTGLAEAIDVTRHAILPVTTLALFYGAFYARLMRASVLDTQHQDFVRTARAKGVPEGRIARVHVMRNAILPVVTLAGIQAGQLVGGSILVETVFAWPGIGRLAFDALTARDYSLLLGIFFVTSALVIGINLLTDLIYRLIDPRIGSVR